MRKIGALIALAIALVAVPCMAQVHMAYTSRDAHLRAGPAREYPVIAILPAGFEVVVQGCLRDYSWCDVIAAPNRGWVYAGNINYPYQGADVPVLKYGAEIGIAIVGFILFDYWAFHYHDRPFYRERDGWVQRPRPPRIFGPPPVVRPEPPKRPDPPRRGEPGVRHPPPASPDKPRPQPPHPGGPDKPHPQPPQQGGPDGQRPLPPHPGGADRPRPPSPRQDGPGSRPPTPPQPGGPDKQRPQPPQPGSPRS